MKLLVVTQSAEISGGANRSLLDVLKHLIRDYGHECLVIVPGVDDFTAALKSNHIDYKCYPYAQTSYVQTGDIYDSYRFVKTLKKDLCNMILAHKVATELGREYFDKIYINDTTNTFGYRLALKLGIPYVWHFRGYNKKIKKYMVHERAFLHESNGICIMISDAMAKYMQKERHMSPGNMVVIHNGVENKGVVIPQPWQTSITDGFHCLHCGHISEAKGQVESIRAIAKLVHSGYTDIYLHLAGTPAVSHGRSYKDFLMRIINKNGIEKHIIFEGEINDIASFRKNMQVELMCSIAEPFGRVTVEGMQSGLVVIGSDTGATPEIIKDGINGLIYHQGDFKDLASKIVTVYENRAKGDFLSATALEFVKTNFTMSGNVEQINNVLLS